MQRRDVVPCVITYSALISAVRMARPHVRPEAFQDNAAARRGALCDHLQRLNQCMRKGQGVVAGPEAL